ncbi:MAG: ABC transporter ATP-binding protein [Deltaproteobacteria bacterium]|nr:ABC transporter ATP-binding protein [Deltaproteobacteria bacterium]
MKELFAALRPYFVRERWLFVIGAALLAVTNLSTLATPLLLKAAIDDLGAGHGVGRLPILVGWIAGLAVFAGALRIGSRFAIFGAGRNVEYRLRNDVFRHLERLTPSFFDRVTTGDVMSRVVNDLSSVRMVLGPGLLNALNSVVVYVATLAAMLTLSPRLTVLTLLPFPLLGLAAKRFVGRLYDKSRESQERLGALTEAIQENLAGRDVVRAFSLEDAEIGRFDAANQAHFAASIGYIRAQGVLFPLMATVGGMGTLLVLVGGGWMVIHSYLSLGALVAFAGYVGMLIWPTFALGWMLSIFQRGRSAMARIQEILDARPEIAAPAVPEPLPEVGGAIEVRDLTFRYPGAAEPALEGLSLAIRRGERVAVVGPTGAGKTTLLRLLVRLWDVPPGTVFVDGVDVTRADPSAVRGRFGLSPQEPFLFSATIRENVELGGVTSGLERLEGLIRTVGFAGDLARMPDGFATTVGERGVQLSVGQRQRLAIARALAPSPQALLLDDPFSAVDAGTEDEILGGLERELAGKTVVLVTHRLEAIRDVDRIVVLDRGRLVEDGSYAELVARDGLFAELLRRGRLERELEALA